MSRPSCSRRWLQPSQSVDIHAACLVILRGCLLLRCLLLDHSSLISRCRVILSSRLVLIWLLIVVILLLLSKLLLSHFYKWRQELVTLRFGKCQPLDHLGHEGLVILYAWIASLHLVRPGEFSRGRRLLLPLHLLQLRRCWASDPKRDGLSGRCLRMLLSSGLIWSGRHE